MQDINIIGAEKGRVTVGKECLIQANVTVVFIGSGTVHLGDYVTIGDNVKIVIEGGDITIGDWSTIHPNSTVFCKKGVSIGAHCWFGQNTVIDGTGGLTIENGVRVGMFSQLWTHVAAGEQMEGCMLIGETPSHIESDAWLVGTCTLGSGVRVGSRTIALAGSNITKSCPPNVVLAGAPAQVKPGLNFYRPVSLDEKFGMIAVWLDDFSNQNKDAVIEKADATISLYMKNQGKVHFHKTEETFNKLIVNDNSRETHCCIENKSYAKKYTPAEKMILKYLSGNKARFYSEKNTTN